ncbi:helix-turn-helix domain-containing protein [Nocardioides montaniterrae]
MYDFPLINDAVRIGGSDVLLTPAEAAVESGFSIETIRDAYRSGELIAFQPRRNGHVKIPRSALELWLARPAARSDERSL